MSQVQVPVNILSSAAFLPPAKPTGTGAASRTGFSFQRTADTGMAASDLGVAALNQVLSDCKIDRKNLGALIVASTSGDYLSPATSFIIHKKAELGSSTLCLDVSSSCTSFLSALQVAGTFCLQSHKHVALVTTEFKSPFLPKDTSRVEAALFSDGAHACILAPSENDSFFQFSYSYIDSMLAEDIFVANSGALAAQSATGRQQEIVLRQPRTLYKKIIVEVERAIISLWDERKRLADSKGRYENQLGGAIYIHQANRFLLEEPKRRLPSDIDSRIVVYCSDVANQVAASLPILRTRARFIEHASSSTKSNISSICPHTHETFTVLDSTPQAATLEELSILQQTFVKPGQPRCDILLAAGGGFQVVGALHWVEPQ